MKMMLFISKKEKKGKENDALKFQKYSPIFLLSVILKTTTKVFVNREVQNRP